MKTFGFEYPAKAQMDYCDIGEPRKLSDTEILIDTWFTGITNGTERHALMAEHFWGQFPSRHGYQHVGQVVQTGSAVNQFKVGDIVFFGHYIGHRGWNIIDVAGPENFKTENHLCVKLPEKSDYSPFALLGVAGVAMRGARRFRVAPAQKVWVLGLGPIGQFAAQSARALGAHVTVTDVNDHRLEVAKQLGAHCAMNARDPQTSELIKQGGPYDCIIECSGIPGFFEQLLRDRLVHHRTVIGLLAVRTETTFNWGLLHIPEASIEVSCHFSCDDLRVLIHFIQNQVIQIEPMISHRVPVTQARDIYRIMAEKPSDLLGVVFDWQD